MIVRVATITPDGYGSAGLIAFRSNKTFLEYDTLVWEPNGLVSQYQSTAVSSGIKGTPISREIFEEIISDINRRNEEMKQMLDLGKSIFVFLPPPQQIYTPDGVIVNLLDYFNFVNLQTSSREGESIVFRGEEPFTTFWEKVKNYLVFKAQLDALVGKPLFFINSTQIVVGSYSQIANGHVILIPTFMIKNVRTQEEINSIKAGFIEAIVDLAKELTSRKDSEIFEIPSWCENYTLTGEYDLKADLLKLEEELNTLQQKINHKSNALEELKKHKTLFVGSGRPLEIEVEYIFLALGFTKIEAAPGRDDLILKYGEKIAVVEIKGISRKSAAERHAAQLEKWVSGYYSDEGVKPKGILVVNAYCEVHLKDRNEDPFPHQMIPFSEAREHCLMTGLQLLGLYLDCKNDEKKKSKMVNLIFETNGIFSEYQDWTKFIDVGSESTGTAPLTGEKGGKA